MLQLRPLIRISNLPLDALASGNSEAIAATSGAAAVEGLKPGHPLDPALLPALPCPTQRLAHSGLELALLTPPSVPPRSPPSLPAMLGSARVHAPVDGRHSASASSASAAASSAAAVIVAAKVIAKPKHKTEPATAATAPDAAAKQIIRVQMLPLNDGAAAQVSKAGLNPLLQLNVPASFTLSGMLRSVLKQRWTAVIGVEGLRLQPPSSVLSGSLDCPAGGWGVEDGQRLTIEALHRRMGHPTPFQLTYTLPGHTNKPAAAAVQPKPQPKPAAAPTTRPATAPPPPLPSLASMRPPPAPLSVPIPAPVSVAPLMHFPILPVDDPTMAMMRFVISQSADAQQLYSSLLAAASPALNLSAASSPNDENSQAPAAMMHHLFNPTPVAPPASNSRLPPSTFRAGDAHIAAQRRAAALAQQIRPQIPATFTGPFVPAAAPSAPATEPARSKKQRLSFGSADSGVQSSLDEQLLVHKRSSAAHTLPTDDDPSLPALPTSHNSFPAPAAAAASTSESFQDLTMLPQLSNDELDAFFSSDELDQPAPVAAAAVSSLPSARNSSLTAATAASATLDPFACTPGRAGSFGSSSAAASAVFGAAGRSSSVKKSLFPSFMAASPATAALSSASHRGAGAAPQSQRNIFESSFSAHCSASTPAVPSTASSLTADRAAVIAAATNAGLAGSDLHLTLSSSSSSSLTSSLSSSRPPLATLFSCSEASALNISNNLSASLPIMSQLQQRGHPPAASAGLSHTAPAASSSAASYTSPVRRSQLGFHSTADKENTPHQPPHASSPARRTATAHAALSFSVQSPSKLAMNGWHALNGSISASAALSFAAAPAASAASAASSRQATKLRPSSVQLAASSSHALSTPRGPKGGAKGSSSTAGSGGSSASGAKKRSREAGGSGGTKGSSSGNKKARSSQSGSGGGKSSKKADGSGGKSASAKKRKQSSPASAASSSKASHKAASASASASATKKSRAKKAKADSPAAAVSAAATAAAVAAAAAAAADDDDDFDLDEWAEELDRELSSDGTESERPPHEGSPSCASSMASPASGAILSAADSPRTPHMHSAHHGGGGGSAVKGLREMDSPLPPVLEMSVEVSMDSTMHQATAATRRDAGAAAASNHAANDAAAATDPFNDPLPSSFFARNASDSDPFPAPSAHAHTDWLPAPLHSHAHSHAAAAASGTIDPDQQHAAFMAMFGEGLHEGDESAVLSESHYTEHQMQMHQQAAAAAGHPTHHAFSSTSPAAPSCSPGF